LKRYLKLTVLQKALRQVNVYTDLEFKHAQNREHTCRAGSIVLLEQVAALVAVISERPCRSLCTSEWAYTHREALRTFKQVRAAV